MSSDELFSDEAGAPEPRRTSYAARRPSRRKLGIKGVGRLLFGIVLLIGTLAGLTVEAVVTASPAFAAATYTCSTPASGGTSATFYTGVTNTENVACYGVSGVSGTSAYPASITVHSGALPSGATQGTSTSSSPACTTSTSGSNTTEEYILTCAITDDPTPSQVGAGTGSGGTYPISYTANPGTDGGTATNSGTLTITVANTTQTCIDPASGGTSTKFVAGYTNTYTVECENETHVSGQAEYPSSIALTSGTGPADAPVTFATSTSSSPACTTATSGSGTTEEYILECGLSFAPTTADVGTGFPFTFTPTTDGVAGSTSGTLTVTPGTETMACTAPASGGTSTTWGSTAGGTNNSYSVACYGEVAQTNVSGPTPYPTSIVPTTPANLPSDLVSATSTSSSPACTKSTSGSGTTEEYILTCNQTEDSVPADNGSYSSTFTASDSNSGGTVTSGAWNLTVSGPSDVCTAPASGGTSTTFKAGISNTYSVTCYGTGFSSSSSGNYPASITLNSGTLPADATEATSTSSSPACTQSTSGSGITEEYILTCNITETPTAADEGTYGPVTFTATPGSNGGNSVTTGPWTLTVGPPPTVTCIDPASGGSSTTFYENTSNSYTVECEAQSGVSGTTAYPTSINIASGGLPADANQKFATSTSSSPACTTTTSGSATTEEYILVCALSATPTSSDPGSYPFTFTASGPGGISSSTSGTLTVTVQPPTTTCSTPASGGTSVSWVDGTAESETITCYSQGFGSSGPGDYPSSITLNSGTLPSDVSEATSTSSSPACTTTTSGSGTSEEYELECKVTETPVPADNGTYHVTFLATGGSGGAPNAVSGTLTVTITQPAPSWATDGSTDGDYFTAIKGVPFCDGIEVSAGQTGPTGTNPGSLYSLPLTSLTAGTTPSGVSNYQIKNVNLTTGTAQLCGTNNNTVASAPVTMAPVATNSAGSATDSIPLWSQNECTWTSTGTGLTTSVTTFDSNQDIQQAGSQSAFGQPITNGVAGGTSKNYPTCAGGVGVSASGGLGDAWTINTANPLPTPTDSNPSAALGDLPSSNLDLTSASSGSVGGCWGSVNILASTSTTTFGSGSTADMTLPSTWVNGGDCSYGSLGSNSAGGNTDTPAGNGPTGDAACPPDQADVNAGYVGCTLVASSGNDENGSINYGTLDLFYNGQPVPQSPTATLSSGTVQAGDTVTVTGGTNWWGDPDGAPDNNPTGDFQNGADDFYSVGAPGVYIGTSRATAEPVVNSTVTIPANTYACTGAESTTVGPNPCTLTVGRPTGTFQVPSNLAPGSYNIYIDESNTTPLPGNGPNDTYQTATGRNLGTVESATPLDVEGVMVVKTAATSYPDGGYSKAGDQITYSFAVTNEGPDTLTNIAVNDNNIPSGDISCPSSSLAGNGSETCTGTYTVTQADVDAGEVTNTATVSGTTPSNELVTSAPSSVTVYASDALTGPITLTKSTSSTGYGAAGNVIPYSYVVTNQGTTTLNGISVSDDLIPNVSCPDSSLAGGASETCTGSYTVTQEDVDNGSVTNSATASGTTDANTTITSSPSSVTVLASNATSSLSLTKATTSTGYGAAGNVIDYTYTVTNTGTTTLSSVSVSDNLVGSVSCPSGSLAPGASVTCTGSYTVTQADVDNGSVTNTATANATGPYANAVSSNTSSVTVDASDATNSLSVQKATSSTGYGKTGDVIDYTYLVTNTGTTTLNGIAVSDNLVAGVVCPDSSLAPGASETCTGSYTVTQADVDNGSVTNTATASGTNDSNVSATSNTSSVTVSASDAVNSLSLTKSTTTTSYTGAGDVIDYSYLVTNTGTTTLNGIAVNDDLIPSVSCPDSTLAPGASETCTGSYTVTQTDVNNGSVTNSATASGTNDSSVTATSNVSTVTVPSTSPSTISLTKSTNSTGYGKAGDVIDYSYEVTNTGATTLSNVAVSDNLIANVSCPDSSLAPSASETCTGSYTVTQSDVDNGSVTNAATATATNPSGHTIVSLTSSVTVEASNATSSLSLAKSTDSGGYGAAGDVIDYSYKVTNTGTTTLSAVAVNDNLVPDVVCPDSSLAPGASETCTGSYTVTQADVDNGSATNTATATADNPQAVQVTSNTSSVTVEANQATTSLSLTKSTDSGGYGAAGDVIEYSYTVTNTGTTTLSNVSVSDSKVADVNCPSGSVAPGASVTCSGSYTVTQADVDNGSVTNTATATADNQQDVQATSNSSSVTVDASDATSSLDLTKATSSTGYSAAGDVIDYTYTVTNTGTTTLSNVAVSDNLISNVGCPDSSLAPGASEICTGSYTVTQQDVDAGSVTNTASATATNPQGHTVTSGSSSVTVEASGASSTLAISKSTSSTGYGQAGDVIDYTYTVTNTGTTTLANVAVSDNKVADVSCPDPSLAPGASETCTGSYTVTQADVDAGSVTNTASATATNPEDATVTSGSVSLTVDASYATSALGLVKSTSSTGYGEAGDVIDYSYAVTNTGTTTLSNVAVSDNKVAHVSCPDSSLAPSASETCTGSYTVTQADVDNGSVTNVATASATAPDPHTISSNSSSVTVDASQATTSVTLTQTSGSTSFTAAGQKISFSDKVTNTGTTTLSHVSVGDNVIANVSCPDSSLAPSASETCTGSYTVTQTDVDNGSVTSTATASAVGPQSNPVSSSPSSVTVDYTGLTITTSSLPALTLGVHYSATLAASGGNGGTLKWAVEAGMPKGLKLSSAGVLSGTVSANKVVPGSYTLTIQVSQAKKGQTEKAVRNLTLMVRS